jgi:PPM family protein phosphatase
VKIFQGVRGSVLGVPLQSIRESSCPVGAQDCDPIRLQDLQEDARSSVRNGIQSTNGLLGAEQIVRRLRATKLLPICPPPEPVQPPATGAPPGQGTPASTQTQPGANPGAAPTEGAPEENNPDANAVPLHTPQLEPGKTCRPEH